MFTYTQLSQLTSSQEHLPGSGDEEGEEVVAAEGEAVEIVEDGPFRPSAYSQRLSLAFVYYLYGCFQLARLAQDSLRSAKQLFQWAADLVAPAPLQPQYTQLLAAAPAAQSNEVEGWLRPLVLYQLAACAEAEGEYATAERTYLEAVECDQLHPLSLLRLLVSIEDAIYLVKARLDKLREPFLREDKYTAAALGESSKPRKKKSKKRPEINAFNYASPTGEAPRGMAMLEDEEDGEEEPEVLPAYNPEANLLVKRLMIHQRVLEAAQVKKFSYQRLLKDLPKGLAVDKVSYLFLEADWLQRHMFAFAQCEDWTALMAAALP